MGSRLLLEGVPALEARGVSKTYDRVRYVLQDVDVRVHPGEVVVLMGRSGSGKTTLLNILAGLETPTDGTVLVGGEDMASLDEEERTQLRREEVGVVFQRFHLIPELNLLENVELPMKLAGRDRAKERARELLEFFGLEDHANAYPATLSGGETQRAAIARGLGNEPAVVLADEPTANLDEDNALNALDALRSVAEELGTAVLIATHDPLGEKAGDRVLNLVDGEIDPETSTVDPRTSPDQAGSGRGQPESSGDVDPRYGQFEPVDPEEIPEVEAEAVAGQGPEDDEED